MTADVRTSGQTLLNGASSRAIGIPGTAQAGDWLIAFVLANQGSSGFTSTDMTLVQDVPNSTLARLTVYKKKLVSGDIGGSATITQTTPVGAWGIAWAIVSGPDTADAVQSYDVSFYGASTTRTLATKTVTRDGSLELAFMGDKVTTTALTSSYSVPAGMTKLQEAYATASGGLSMVLARRSGVIASGATAGGEVITADAAPSNIAGAVVVISPAVNAQYARPASDVTKTSVSATPAVTVFAGNIDEATVDTSDYVSFDAVGAVYETKLGALVDPQTGSGHEVAWSIAAAPGSTSSTWQLDVVEGTTVRATFTRTVGTTATTFTEALSSTQANAIGVYSDLRLRFTLTAAS